MNFVATFLRFIFSISLFVFLLLKGLEYINHYDPSLMKFYVVGWNLTLNQLNQFQYYAFGSVKISLSGYQLTGEDAIQTISSNIGGIYLFISAAAISHSMIIRGISIIALSGIYYIYQNISSSTDVLIEKNSHLVAICEIIILALIQPKVFNQKEHNQIAKQNHSLFSSAVSPQSFQKTTLKSHIQKKKQQKEESFEEEQEEEDLLSLLQQPQQNSQLINSIEIEEELEEINLVNEEIEEEAEKETIKRKFKVDEDGFSIVSAKSPHKKQQFNTQK